MLALAVAFAIQLGPLTKFIEFLSNGIGPDREDDGLWLFLDQGSKVSDEGKPMQKPRRTAASPVDFAAVLLRALQKEPLEFLSNGIGPDREDDGLWLFLDQGSKVSDEGKPMQKPRRTAASPVDFAAALLRTLQKEPLEVCAVRASLVQARHGERKDHSSTGDDSVGDSGIGGLYVVDVPVSVTGHVQQSDGCDYALAAAGSLLCLFSQVFRQKSYGSIIMCIGPLPHTLIRQVVKDVGPGKC
ncbi:hypothetical protein BN1708_012781, partial [Verticillium longisporum]